MYCVCYFFKEYCFWWTQISRQGQTVIQMKGECSGVTAEWLWRTVSCGCAQLRQHKDVIEDTFNLFIHSFIHKIRWFQISLMPLLCEFSINNILSPWLLAKEGKGWKVGSRAPGCTVLPALTPWHLQEPQSMVQPIPVLHSLPKGQSGPGALPKEDERVEAEAERRGSWQESPASFALQWTGL